MIELKERGGHYYVAVTGSADEDNVYDILRRHGSYRFDKNFLAWQIPESCYQELKEYAITIGEVGGQMKLPLFPYQKDVVSFCLEKGCALCAVRRSVGRIFNVASAVDFSFLCQQRRTDPVV